MLDNEHQSVSPPSFKQGSDAQGLKGPKETSLEGGGLFSFCFANAALCELPRYFPAFSYFRILEMGLPILSSGSQKYHYFPAQHGRWEENAPPQCTAQAPLPRYSLTFCATRWPRKPPSLCPWPLPAVLVNRVAESVTQWAEAAAGLCFAETGAKAGSLGRGAGRALAS